MNRALTLTVSLLLSACSSPDGAPIAVERDSANIRIVENRWAPEEVAAGWSVDPEPLVEIGVLEGDEALQLFRVSGGRVLTDGRLAVVNGGTSEVRIYRADGVPDTVFGGEGEGPGEFRGVRLAGSVGDTLVLYDGNLRRVTVWHPEAGVIREFAVGGEGGGFPVAQGVFADGSIVFGGGLSFSSQTGFPTGLIRQASAFGSVTSTGGAGVSFGDFPGAEMYATVSGSSFSARSIPFGRTTTAVAADSMLWIGMQDAWELRGYSMDGRLVRMVRVDRPLVAVTPELKSRFVDEALDDAADETERRRLRQQYAEMPFGEFVPPYGPLAADESGFLWVADAALPGDERRGWSVFDAAGRLAGRVELSATAVPLHITADRILVRVTDDLGVERVRLLRLTRPD